MDFLNQTMYALRGPTEAPQSAQSTITKLVDRLTQSTQLEDRRAAILALRGLSRDYCEDVGSLALDALLGSLEGDVQVDGEISKAVLQTLNTLCEVADGEPTHPYVLRHTDKILQNPLHTQNLFSLLTDTTFYTRYGTLQLLNTLVQNRRPVVQQHFINAPQHSQTVTAVLEEKRDMVRNEGLQLFQGLIAQNTDIQTIFAFGGAFESLLRIIAQEGGVEGGLTVQGCLIAIEGLLRFNSSTQNYFRELLPSLPPLLLFPPTISPEEESPQQFALQYWDEQKARNASLVVSIIGIMKAPEHIRMLTELGIASNAPITLKAQALRLISAFNQKPSLTSQVIPYAPVPESNGEEWDRLEPVRGIDLLVLTVLDGEYGGVGVSPALSKDSMDLRAVTLTVFEDFVKEEGVSTDLLSAMIPGSATSTSASQLLLTAISTLPASPLSPLQATRLQFSALLFACFFHGPPNMSSTSPKAIARGLANSASIAEPSSSSFFVPADTNGAPPPAEPEEEEEPPSSLLQLLTEHLSLSLLARSRVGGDEKEGRSWDKVVVGYLVLLCTWLWEDPKSVRIFLEGGGVGVLVEPISQTSGVDVLVQGLCSFLFGICYHFNREPGGEITRRTLHSIISRLGPDQLVARMSRVREDERFRYITPESIILASPSGGSIHSAGNAEGEIWLDWGFIEFWKGNFYTVQRGLSSDPDSVAQNSGDILELQTLIASLREVIKVQADELHALKANSSPPKAQSKAPEDSALLQKKLDELTSEREGERESLQKQISSLSLEVSEMTEKKKEQEKEQEDLLVFLEELSEKRKRDKAKMRTAGLDVSEDEGDEEVDD